MFLIGDMFSSGRRIPSDVVVDAGFHRNGLDIGDVHSKFNGEVIWAIQLDFANGDSYVVKYLNEDIILPQTEIRIVAPTDYPPISYELRGGDYIRKRILALTKPTGSNVLEKIPNTVFLDTTNTEVLAWKPVEIGTGIHNMRVEARVEGPTTREFRVSVDEVGHLTYETSDPLEGVVGTVFYSISERAALSSVLVKGQTPDPETPFPDIEELDPKTVTIFSDNFSGATSIVGKTPFVGSGWSVPMGFISNDLLYGGVTGVNSVSFLCARALSTNFPIYTLVNAEVSVGAINPTAHSAPVVGLDTAIQEVCAELPCFPRLIFLIMDESNSMGGASLWHPPELIYLDAGIYLPARA